MLSLRSILSLGGFTLFQEPVYSRVVYMNLMDFFNMSFDEMGNGDGNSVNSVSPDTLSKRIKEEKIIGVLFYANWCFYCQKFFKEWDTAETKLKLSKPDPIPLIRFDAAKYQWEANKYSVDRYPTIKFFFDGVARDYPDDQPNTWQGVVRWTNKEANSHHVLSSIKETEHLLHDAPGTVIGFFDDPSDADRKMKQAALEYGEDDVLFASVISPEAGKEILDYMSIHHELKCKTIHVGSHLTGGEKVAEEELPWDDMDCGEHAKNPQNANWEDEFSTSVIGRKLTVQRSDKDKAPWQQNLKVRCCMNFEHQEKNSKIDLTFPTMVMFTDHPDDPFSVYKGDMKSLKVADIVSFAKEHAMDKVTELTDENQGKIFSMYKPILFLDLLRSAGTQAAKDAEEAVWAAAREGINRKNFVVVISRDESDVANRLEKMLNINDEDDQPIMRIFKAPRFQHDEPKKYKTLDAITKENIVKFTEDFTAGKIFEYAKSEPILDEEDRDPEDALILVGDDVEKVAKDPKKDVFVDFFAPWCGHCTKLMPIWKKLHQELKHASDTLTISKIDATANEIKMYPISGYPTIVLFPADGGRPIEFQGERTVEGFKNWLVRRAQKKFNPVKPTTTKKPRPPPQEQNQEEVEEEYIPEHAVDL